MNPRYGILIRQPDPDDPWQAEISGIVANDLAELQAAVGGWIEAIPTSNDVTMWCNESAKLIGLRPNPLATWLWMRFDYYGCVPNGDYVAGPMLVQGGRHAGACTTEPPTKALEFVLNLTGWYL